MVESTNQVFLSILVVSLALGLGYFLWKGYINYSKEDDKADFGEYIHYLGTKYFSTISICTLILIGLAEAGVAASIHVQGQAAANPIFRFMMHLVFAIAYTSAAFFIPRALGNFIQSFGKDAKFYKILSTFFLFISVVIVAYSLPIVNLMLIANGLGEVDKVQLFLYSLISSKEYMQSLYVDFGLPPTYGPYAALSYIMAASIICTLFVHNILALTNSIYGYANGGDRVQIMLGNLLPPKKPDLTSEQKRQAAKDAKANAPADPLEDKEKVVSAIDNVRHLLVRLDYGKDDSKELDHMVKLCKETLDSITDDDIKISIGTNAAKLRIRLKDLDNKKASISKDKFRSEMDTIVTDIRAFFAKSTKQGGFGKTLKKQGNSKG